MKYRPLIEPCKSCLGCQRLENPNFIGDKNCKYAEKENGCKVISTDKEEKLF